MASTSDMLKKARINTYLPLGMVEQLDAEAIRLGMSRSNVLCLCIDYYFRAQAQEKVMNKGAQMIDEVGIHAFLEQYLKNKR